MPGLGLWWWVNYLRLDGRFMSASAVREYFHTYYLSNVRVHMFPQDLYPREDDLPRHSVEIPIFPNLPLNPRR